MLSLVAPVDRVDAGFPPIQTARDVSPSEPLKGTIAMYVRKPDFSSEAEYVEYVREEIRCFRKPDFRSTDEYVEYVREEIRLGYRPCGPTSVDELIAVHEALPDYAKQQGWLGKNMVRDFGLPADYFDPIEPLSDRKREQLLLTIRDDDEFRLALRFLILGGTAA